VPLGSHICCQQKHQNIVRFAWTRGTLDTVQKVFQQIRHLTLKAFSSCDPDEVRGTSTEAGLELAECPTSILGIQECRRENLRVLVNSTKKGVSQLHKGNAESTSKHKYTEMSRETSESQE
jgi:hypothetical protein